MKAHARIKPMIPAGECFEEIFGRRPKAGFLERKMVCKATGPVCTTQLRAAAEPVRIAILNEHLTG